MTLLPLLLLWFSVSRTAAHQVPGIDTGIAGRMAWMPAWRTSCALACMARTTTLRYLRGRPAPSRLVALVGVAAAAQCQLALRSALLTSLARCVKTMTGLPRCVASEEGWWVEGLESPVPSPNHHPP